MTTKSIGIDADANESGLPNAAAGLTVPAVSRRLVLSAAAAGTLVAAGGAAAMPAWAGDSAPSGVHPHAGHGGRPLWRIAAERGIAFGSSTATWQTEDKAYERLFDRQAGVLFTEDDLLWYKLKPTPDAPLDFSFGDRLINHARQQGQHVLAAHLVWDEGFGEGWPEDYLWELDRAAARKLLFGTARAMVDHYRGRIDGWIAANEVTDPEGDGGFRTDVPWYATIGKSYVREIFELARRRDPHATLVLNEFGFETTNEFGDDPRDRQLATLRVIDTLLAQGTPVDALGIQAHLLADDFANRFDRRQYARFLDEVADRGLKILITEMDVLDDGLPADIATRDRAVADIYARYLDTALDHRAVKVLITFGLSDRYTWLQEDYPREDGAARRPLPYDEDLSGKPALRALRRELRQARRRKPLWRRSRR